MTSENPLLDALAAARPAPTPPAPPKGFEPGFRFTPNGNLDSVTFASDLPPGATQDDYDDAARAQGVPLPEDMSLQLVEVKMGHNSASWMRDPGDRREKFTAYTAPNTVWYYRFKVVPKSLWRGKDYEALAKAAKKAAKARLRLVPASRTRSEVVVLGDFQAGKTDYLGGTPELLERSEVALAQVLRKIRRVKPAEIVLVDVGDSMEGFESAPNAAQTNDLDLTEQVTVWRRILWRWIEALAKSGVPVKVIGVPSNHCRVRKGKNAQGKPSDDWGLQTIGAVADMAAINPDAFGHVEFFVPETHDEHLAITLVGGKVLGAFHGHQKGSVEQLLSWLDGQAAGRSPVGHADIVVCGHFHNWRALSWGDDRWLFVSPAMDSGSSWYSNLSGRKSRPGVFSFTVDENGWDPAGLFLAWAN